nr:glutamate-gated chloride channel alpha-like [Dermacentor andersoni]
MKPTMQIHEYDVQPLTRKYKRNWNTESAPFTGVHLQLRLSRRFAPPLLSTFLPSALLVCLSWCVLWMRPRHLPERISLTLMLLLALYAQMSAVRQSLPPSNYLTGGDVWMFGCFSFVFGSLVESTLVHHITERAARRRSF